MAGPEEEGDKRSDAQTPGEPSAPLSREVVAAQPPKSGSRPPPASRAVTQQHSALGQMATEKGTYIGAGPKIPPLSSVQIPGPPDLKQLVERYSVVTPVPTDTAPNGRYVKRGFIGAGGMGYVLRVYDRLVGRNVAMKVLAKELFDNTAARSRFFNEARIAANLQHPGIIAVHNFGELSDGRPFFTMKEVHGRTFDHFIEEFHSSRAGETARSKALRKFVEALKRVCEAIAYAHDQGFIHRDLKPQNLMMGMFGEVQVVDWGLAVKLHDASDLPFSSSISPSPLSAEVDGAAIDLLAMPSVPSLADEQPRIAGTLCYMPPEQARGDLHLMGSFSDVYAMGAVLYHMLSGHPPYALEQNVALALHRGPPARLSDMPPNPLRPSALCVICERAMARAPEARYFDAGLLARALENWMHDTQRHQRATALVASADSIWRGTDTSSAGPANTDKAGIAALRDLAGALRRQADKILAKTNSYDHVSTKKPAWALIERAAALEQLAAVKEVEWQQTLRSALNEEPEHPEAHQRLAVFYRRLHEGAERAHDREVMARSATLLRAHDRGAHHDYLQGEGRLNLVTHPARVRAHIREYQMVHRRLRPGPIQDLGFTPLKDLRLKSGSYLITLRAPGYQRLRYPVKIMRGGTWDTIRPGQNAPQPVALAPLGALSSNDVYVPAGWFLSGGDPNALEGLPARRLWADGFVMKRHPVTRAQYREFLNALVDEGKASEALMYAPKMPFGSGDSTPAWPQDANGHFELDPTWSDANQARWPVTLVNWTDACAYAKWLAKRTNKPWRLPNELEWEKAARGVDGRFLPWGDYFEPTFACVVGSHDGPVSARPVFEHKRFHEDTSPYGIRGMAGNVRDWCSNPWLREGPPLTHGALLSLKETPQPEATDAAGQLLRSARGGAWTSPAMSAHLATRFAGPETFIFRGLGFRLVYSTDFAEPAQS